MLCTGCNKLQIAEISPASSQRIKMFHKSRVQPAHLITQGHQLNWELPESSPGHLAPCWILPFPSRELSWPAPGGIEQQHLKGSKPSSFLRAGGGHTGPIPSYCLHTGAKYLFFIEPALTASGHPQHPSPSRVPVPRDLLGSVSSSSINPSLQNTLNTWPFLSYPWPLRQHFPPGVSLHPTHRGRQKQLVSDPHIWSKPWAFVLS